MEGSITIEKLLHIVHSYTNPIRIHVVMGDAWLYYTEAKRKKDFYLTRFWRYNSKEETERMLKYYKDVPVWNLSVWHDFTYANSGEYQSCLAFGIQAQCHYSDIRNGFLAESVDIKNEIKKRKKDGAKK